MGSTVSNDPAKRSWLNVINSTQFQLNIWKLFQNFFVSLQNFLLNSNKFFDLLLFFSFLVGKQGHLTFCSFHEFLFFQVEIGFIVLFWFLLTFDHLVPFIPFLLKFLFLHFLDLQSNAFALFSDFITILNLLNLNFFQNLVQFPFHVIFDSFVLFLLFLFKLFPFFQ